MLLLDSRERHRQYVTFLVREVKLISDGSFGMTKCYTVKKGPE